MGCTSSQPTDSVSQSIDKQLKQDAKVFQREVKLLLLGPGESGKSTIAKQMKIIHLDGFTQEELMIYRPVVHNNALNCIKTLVTAGRKLNIPISDEHEELADKFAEINPLNTELNPDVATDIKELLKDDGIQATFERSAEFQLPDVAKYCFEHIDRIADPDYVPTEEDALRCRARTTGIIEIEFDVDAYHFRMVDVGGQRSERKKWIHCFQDVTAVIFCVALSEYNQKLYEDETVNRMHESLELFKEICNSKWFSKTSMVLFLNKSDLFAEKIKKVDLKVCFPKYTGGKDYDAACNFVEEQFMALNEHPQTKQVYPHITCATDTGNVKFVFNATKEIILRSMLAEYGAV